MSTAAYLLAFVDTTVTPPTIVGAGIFSSNHITTELRKRFAVEVMRYDSKTSYSDSVKRLKECVVTGDFYDWLKPMLRGQQ